MKVLYSMLLVSALASGCVRARANTTPDAPLDVPEPPPREVAPNDVEPPPPVPLVAEPARSALPRPSAPREQPKPEPSKPEPARAEPPVPEPAPEPPPRTADDPARAPTTLQTHEGGGRGTSVPATVQQLSHR